jgi:hypothetical protein
MLTTGGLRPRGMNDFTSSVFGVLEKFIVSPWNVLKVECGWKGVDPLSLTPENLRSILPKVHAHIARMTDTENADEALVALEALVEGGVPIEFDV